VQRDDFAEHNGRLARSNPLS